MYRYLKIISILLFLFPIANYAQTNISANPEKPLRLEFFKSGVFGDTIVHMVWENPADANIKTVSVERSTDGINYTTINTAEISKLPDIHALYYPKDFQYNNNILYSTEAGHGRFIYNDITKDIPADVNKFKYRIQFGYNSGIQKVSEYVFSNQDPQGSGEAQPKTNLTAADSILNQLKSGGMKSNCPVVETPPSGYTPTSQVTTTYGSCCYYVTTVYQTGIIQVPCGGGSYAWCCNNVPGASACLSGYLWDPCCVHYCSEFNACSCHPWSCCNVTLVTQPVVTQSVDLAPLGVTAVVVDETCNGMLDGSIAVTVANGSAPINYTWSNGGPNSDTQTNLGGGTYTVTITDVANCQSVQTYTVNSIPGTPVSLLPFPAYCISQPPFTLTGGSPLGGTFSGPGVTGTTFDPNASGPGSHNIIYTYIDSIGCIGRDTAQMVIYPLPTINFPAINPMCIDAGLYTLNAATPPGGTYSGPGVTGSVFNPAQAGPGTHSIMYTYTDGNGCTNSALTNIIVNPLPVVSFAPLNPMCVTAPAITLTQGTPSGGTYTGTGVNGGIFDPMAAGLGTFVLTYTYTDSNSCVNAATQSITVNVVPVAAFSAMPDVCTNTTPFALTAGTPSGGTYSGTGVSNNMFYPAIADTGTFTITYIYINGANCADTAYQDITVNYTPTSTFTVTSPICDLSDSSLVTYTGTGDSLCTYAWSFAGGVAVPAGGSGPFDVNWSTPGIKNVTLSVTLGGCTSAVTTVPVFVSDIQTTTAQFNVLCFQGNSGFASVNATNGISPYHYLWGTVPPQANDTAFGLTDGTYIVTITDTSTCFVTDTVTITEPPLLEGSVDTTSIVSCYGGNDGTAQASAIGGNDPYQYTWSAGTPANDYVSGLPAGNFTVTVTDSNGCTDVVPFIITQHPQMFVTLHPTDEGCLHECNGYILTTVTGGVPPYQYQWSLGNQDTLALVGLCTGNYTITVTDQFNCPTTAGPAIIGTNTLIHADGYSNPVDGISPLNVNFYYNGSGANIFYWDFGDGTNSASENPSHTYVYDCPPEQCPDCKTFKVMFNVNSGIPDFCEDSISMEVKVCKPSAIVIPNVFTPDNGDGQNDVFKVQSVGLLSEQMVIFNRWGKKVYEWYTVHGSWDGHKEGGAKASDGVYYYVFTAKGFDGIEYSTQGTVTLLR
ncbi:MAG: gliding motility-associated C-terminal domain-containing protein [Bacteroidota bacterium]